MNDCILEASSLSRNDAVESETEIQTETLPTGAVGAPSARSVICCQAMTDKPVIPEPPKVPPRRAEHALLRRTSSAELAEALKAHRRWLKHDPRDGRRIHLDGCDLTGAALR